MNEHIAVVIIESCRQFLVSQRRITRLWVVG